MSKISIEELNQAFDPEILEKRRIELIELSSVSYGSQENGFLSVVHNKKKNTISYLLAINENGRVYNIKAFCFYPVKEKYDSKIRNCLENVYIGEYEEAEQPFKMAKIISINEMIFTRDGKYPTESNDQSVIEFKGIESLRSASETDLVENELQKLTGVKKNSAAVQFLSNGKYCFGSATSEDKKAYVALLVLENKEGTLIRCYGNKNSNLDEFASFVKGKLVKTRIR